MTLAEDDEILQPARRDAVAVPESAARLDAAAGRVQAADGALLAERAWGSRRRSCASTWPRVEPAAGAGHLTSELVDGQASRHHEDPKEGEER